MKRRPSAFTLRLRRTVQRLVTEDPIPDWCLLVSKYIYHSATTSQKISCQLPEQFGICCVGSWNGVPDGQPENHCWKKMSTRVLSQVLQVDSWSLEESSLLKWVHITAIWGVCQLGSQTSILLFPAEIYHFQNEAPSQQTFPVLRPTCS